MRPFGSFVHGVGLPGADLDLVVTGMMSPIARGGGGLPVLLGLLFSVCGVCERVC